MGDGLSVSSRPGRLTDSRPGCLAVQGFQAPCGPLDAGWRVRIEHELDMTDAGVSVAGQVCGELLRLSWLETRLFFTWPPGRGGQVDQQAHGPFYSGRVASRPLQRGVDLLPILRQLVERLTRPGVPDVAISGQ